MTNNVPETHESASKEVEFEADGTLSFLELLVIFVTHKRLIGGITFAATALAALASFLIPPTYTGRASILPPAQGQSVTAAALLGNLGVLGNSLAGGLGIKNPAELYVGMLKGRTISDALVTRFKLQELYDADTLVDARKELEDVTTIFAGKDGIIVIEVEDTDPQRAADMANAYHEELHRLTQTIAVTEASQRRLYLERQLIKAKDSLADAEVALRMTQERTGLIQLDAQQRAIIEAVAKLRAEIAAREVQVTAMSSFATESNPDVVRLRKEIAGLVDELKKLTHDKQPAREMIDVPTAKIPELGLEYVRRYREVKYNETLFELLARQYEIARSDEAKDAGFVQVIDHAVRPDKRSKPKRVVITAISGALGFILSIALALVLEVRRRDLAHPERRKLWDELSGRFQRT